MTSILDQVWARKYSEKQSSLLSIHRKFYQNLEQTKNGKVNFEKKLEECTSNFERIETVKQFYEWIPFNATDVKRYQKSRSLSTQFRERGNELYKNQKFDLALKAYNLALSFAPSKGEDFALVLGNRSALFVQSGRPIQALRDLIRCFNSHNYPEHLKPKLLERKLKCLKVLKLEGTYGDSPLEEVLSTLESEELKKLQETEEYKYCRLNIFRLQCANPLIPTAEDFVKIESSPERGRHIVVTKNVTPGTVLIVDRPFSKVLLKEVSWDLEHCSHCHSNRCESGIPCLHCAFAFYCSNKCLNEAWEMYHQFECPCTAHLHLMKSTRNVLLAFRIICTVGPDQLKKLFLLRAEPNTESEDKVLGSDENNVYNSESYLPIFNLISHPSQHSHPEMVSYSLTSLALVSILENYTTFFDTVNHDESIVKSEFSNFVASLILLHIQNLPCNAHSLNELRPASGTTLASVEDIRNAVCMEYGAGAFALLSLINHSCDPNVYRINLNSGHTAVVAIRGLKTGEEVLDNYGSHYAIEEIFERKKHLYDHYFFDCSCVACKYKWPLMMELKNMNEVFVCPNCTDFKLPDKCDPTGDYQQKCVFQKGRSVCQNCSTTSIVDTRSRELNLIVDKFICAYDNVLGNKPLIAIQNLIECLTYYENNLLPPVSRTNEAQETFKQALNLIVHFTQGQMFWQ